jgi:hypothetical protein
MEKHEKEKKNIMRDERIQKGNKIRDIRKEEKKDNPK